MVLTKSQINKRYYEKNKVYINKLNTTQYRKKIENKEFYCDECDRILTSKVSLNYHFNSKLHAKIVALNIFKLLPIEL